MNLLKEITKLSWKTRGRWIFYPLLGLLFIMGGCDFIIQKMAFYPDNFNFSYENGLPQNVIEVFLHTPDDIRLQCYFLPRTDTDPVLVYFHGNAGNASHRLDDAMRMRDMGVQVLLLSYRGYGKSEGSPTEQGIYQDAETVLAHLQKERGVPLNRIFLYGRSLGSTVAMYLASQHPFAGVILITPMSSAKDYAKKQGLAPLAWIAGDSFDNLSRMKQLQSPLLIIHGDQDEVLSFDMGKACFDEASVTDKTWVPIMGGSHNDLSLINPDLFWESIAQFLKSHNPDQIPL